MTGRTRQDLFRQGIDLFNREEFFECHEVLEQLWVPARQSDRWFLQSLIHFSVGFYHYRLKNITGASKQLNKGLKKIQRYLPVCEGVDTASIDGEVRRCLACVKTGEVITIFPKIKYADSTGLK